MGNIAFIKGTKPLYTLETGGQDPLGSKSKGKN